VLSLEDLFLAGLGFDVAGAVLLGRSLLWSPADARRRTGMWIEFNAADLAAAARDRADATFGIFGLATGFILQGAGYVATLAGAHIREGGAGRIALGVVFLLAAVLAVAALRLWLGWPVMRRFVIGMASVSPSQGEDVQLDRASFGILEPVGDRLGRPRLSNEEPAAYAKRVYGLDEAEVAVGADSAGSNVSSIVDQYQREQAETFYKPMEAAVVAGVRRLRAFLRGSPPI
jgi:hypothetical protein